MKSNVENRVKRILGISLAVILMSGNFIPSYATVAAADHTDTATVKTESVNTLSYDNQDDPDKKEEDQNLKVTISQEKDFEDGQTAFISEIIDEKKLEEYKNSLNSDVLQSERSEIEDIKLATEIAVRDKDGKDAELKEKAKVRIGLNDADTFNGYALFHYKKDQTWEKLDFAIQKTEEKSYLEFETDSFSPYLFVKVKDTQAQKEPAKQAEQANKQAGDQTEAAAQTASELCSRMEKKLSFIRFHVVLNIRSQKKRIAVSLPMRLMQYQLSRKRIPEKQKKRFPQKQKPLIWEKTMWSHSRMKSLNGTHSRMPVATH